METKSFALISGNGENNRWYLRCRIRANETFHNIGTYFEFNSMRETMEYHHSYYRCNKEKMIESCKRFRERNRGKMRKIYKRYYKIHKTKRKEYAKAHHRLYLQTEKGKIFQKRRDSKRRQLGFIPLNATLGCSEGHHITEQYVLYIPKELHHSVSHNIWSYQNMLKINEIAIEYLLNPMNYWNDIFENHYDVLGEEEMLETAKSKPLFE